MGKKKKEFTSITNLGEFGLIDRIKERVKIRNKSTITGIGDDAAVIDNKNKKIIVTTDLLTEGIHFNLMYTPLKHLGYKSVIVNLSDIYAMNASPKQITVSIAVSDKISLNMIDEFYAGVLLACEYYGVDLVGGDTSGSLTGFIISVTAIGEAEPGKIIYRNGANVNDLICVTGDLGASYMGLQILEREKKLFEKDPSFKPDLTGYDYLLERQLKPEARKDMIEFFTEKNVRPTSMIDISDGLSSDLLHICKNSKTGCKIYSERIPIHDETMKISRELNIEPLVAALNGGEDYELLFTISPEDHPKIAFSDFITPIGNVTDHSEGNILVFPDQSFTNIKALGWNSML